MSSGRAHLSVITLAALLLGGLAAWGYFNYARAPKLTPELRGYQLAEDLGCHGCHGPRGGGGVPNIGTQEGEIPAWDGGMSMMYVKDEKEIREWILDGRPWRLAMRDSLNAHALEKEGRAHRDSISGNKTDRERAENLLSKRLPSQDTPWKPPLRMPAFRGVVTEQQLDDLVAYYKVIADFDPMPDNARAGYHAAKDLGCFGCHGPGGLITAHNARSFKGYIPPWRGPDFHDLVHYDSELKQWILDGHIDRLQNNKAALFFTRRQVIKMPAYRGVASDSTVAAVIDYVKWVNEKEGNVATEHGN
jgi:mono/diheme cytochrome c family protein